MKDETAHWREALKVLAEDVPEGNPEVRERLLGEFRKAHPRRLRKLWWGAVAAAAAGVMLLIFRPAPHAPVRTALPLPPRALAKAAPAPAVSRPQAPVRRVRRAYSPKRVKRVRPVEVGTAFYALPYASIPAENLEVFRVSVPRSAMSEVGIPVSPDQMFEPVQADVAVGEDGLARAIRFVQ